MFLSLLITISQRLIVWLAWWCSSLCWSPSPRDWLMVMWYTWRSSYLWWSPSPRDWSCDSVTWRYSFLWWSQSHRDWSCDSLDDETLFGNHHVPETDHMTHLTIILSSVIANFWLIIWLTWRWFSLQWSPSPRDWSRDSTDEFPRQIMWLVWQCSFSLVITVSQRLIKVIMWLTWRWSFLKWSPTSDWSYDSPDNDSLSGEAVEGDGTPISENGLHGHHQQEESERLKNLFDYIGQCHDEASPSVPFFLLSALGSIHVIMMYACCDCDCTQSVVGPDCLRAGFI